MQSTAIVGRNMVPSEKQKGAVHGYSTAGTWFLLKNKKVQSTAIVRQEQGSF